MAELSLIRDTAAMGSAANNTSTFDITMFDLQGAIELHCSVEENIDGDICLVHRLSPEVTYDDVDYVLNKSHYSGSVLISGNSGRKRGDGGISQDKGFGTQAILLNTESADACKQVVSQLHSFPR